MKSTSAIIFVALLLFGCTQQEERPLDLSSWDTKTIAEMGTPIHCVVTYRSQNFSADYHMYFLGENSMTTGEFTVFGNNTFETTQIIKTVNGAKMNYFKLEPEGAGAQNCDWNAYELEEGTGLPREGDTPNSYECFYATFGQEKFATPGEICPRSSLGG